MAYTNHKFCWHGIISTDTAAAADFYNKAIGFEIMDVAMGDGTAKMAAAGGVPRAHIGEPQMEGVPSHWDNYLRVEDVDASAAAAAANGGAVIVPGTDIPPGRFAVVASPSGAVFALFHESDYEQSQNAPAGHGSIHWVELHSTDVQADLTWLKGSFGFTIGEMSMPDGPYYLINDGDTQVGGAMTQKHEGAPSMWLTWLQVDDVDATLAAVGEAGGNALTPVMAVPNVGRMSVVSDPTGGVFGVITPPAAG